MLATERFLLQVQVTLVRLVFNREIKTMKNTFGFSILELMMAVGISGMAAIGVMQMTEDQVKIQKRVRTEFDIDTLVNVVQKIIVNRQACSTTFANRPIDLTPGNTSPIPQVIGPGGVVLINPAVPYGDIDIIGIDYVFRGVTPDIVKGVGIPAGSRKIIGDIEIRARKRSILTNPNNAVLARRLPYPIELIVNGANVIGADGCIPAVKDIDDDVAEEICRLVTNGNGAIVGNDCDTTLIPAVPENSTTLVPPLSATRALSFQTMTDQIGPDDTSGAGLIRNLGANNDGNLFSTSRDTLGKFVPLSGGIINGDLTLNNGNGSNPSLIIQDTSFSGNDLVTRNHFLGSGGKANIERSSECTSPGAGGALGMAATGGRKCFPNSCGNNQYAKGIDSSSTVETGLNCGNTVQAGSPTCFEGDGAISVNSTTGELEFNC